MLGLRFRPRPATPGCVVGLCACSAFTQPLLARVRGVGVCVWARDLAAPRQSWLGCWAVCVLRLHPATPGTGGRCGCVCLGSGFGCAPPLLAGVLGCVCALLAPSHFWHGCAVWVCVFGLGFRLRPATPGSGVGLCACSACTQQLLARVRGVCVCVWGRDSAAPRHSWLGCWAVCVLRLHPATPGTGARCRCVCLGSGFGCALPLLAGVLGCVRAPLAHSHSWHGCAVWVCVFGLGIRLRPATPGWGVGLCAYSACTQPLLARVRGVGVCVWARVSAAPRHSWLRCWAVCVLRLHPATPGTAARCGCVCLGSVFGCAPPLLVGVLGCACAPLAPSHSWHGCAVLVCVFGPGFRLRPAIPGWGVWLCACSACTLPLLARVRGVGVCVWARVSAAPRTPGWGVRWVSVLGLGFWLRPATPGWVLWCLGWLLPGTCSCAVFRCVLCALSGFVAPGGRRCLAPVRVPTLLPAAYLSGVPRGPAWCAAPRPVRSLSVLRSAFPSPWCLSPPRGLAPSALLGSCVGHAEAGRQPGSLCLPLAPAEAGALGSLRVVPVRGPAMGLSLAGPSGVGLGLRALRWLACVDPDTGRRRDPCPFAAAAGGAGGAWLPGPGPARR